MARNLKIVALVFSCIMVTSLFQNCGSSDSGSNSQSSIDDDLVKKDVVNITGVVGADVSLQVSASLKGAMVGNTCSWSYLDDKGDATALAGSADTYVIADAKVEDTGTYVLKCVDAQDQIKVLISFSVTIELVTGVGEKGVYRGFLISVGGSIKEFVNMPDITKEDALKNCEENAVANPGKGIFCTWNDETIKEQAASDGSTKADYEAVKFVADTLTVLETKKSVTSIQAIDYCVGIAEANKDIPLYCKWNSKVFYQQDVDVDGFKGVYKYYAVKGGKNVLGKTINDITKKDALAKCKATKPDNVKPEPGVVCTWTFSGKTTTIYKKAEGVLIKSLYEGYYVKAGKNSLFKSKKGLTENEALTDCKAYAAKDLKAGVKCYYTLNSKKKTIFTRAEPKVDKKQYQGYYIIDGKNVKFSDKIDVSEADALADCKAKAAAKKTAGVICKWKKDEKTAAKTIFSRKEPVSEYLGYLIVKGKNVKFASKEGLKEAAALANCKEKANAKANLKSGALCKWRANASADWKTIFSRKEKK